MLAYILAIAVGVSSFILFTTAFSLPDIHRKDDFFWSGIGLFYALVLWFCASRITGGVLLGQAAAVALLVSNNWQIIKLRKAIAYPNKEINLDDFSVTRSLQNTFSGLLSRFSKSEKQSTILEPKTNETTPVLKETDISSVGESISPSTYTQETADTQKSSNKGFSFGNVFDFAKKKPSTANKSSLTNTKLDEVLEEHLDDDTLITKATIVKESIEVTIESKEETVVLEETTFEQVTEKSDLPENVSADVKEKVKEEKIVEIITPTLETETPEKINISFDKQIIEPETKISQTENLEEESETPSSENSLSTEIASQPEIDPETEVNKTQEIESKTELTPPLSFLDDDHPSKQE